MYFCLHELHCSASGLNYKLHAAVAGTNEISEKQQEFSAGFSWCRTQFTDKIGWADVVFILDMAKAVR